MWSALPCWILRKKVFHTLWIKPQKISLGSCTIISRLNSGVFHSQYLWSSPGRFFDILPFFFVHMLREGVRKELGRIIITHKNHLVSYPRWTIINIPASLCSDHISFPAWSSSLFFFLSPSCTIFHPKSFWPLWLLYYFCVHLVWVLFTAVVWQTIFLWKLYRNWRKRTSNLQEY